MKTKEAIEYFGGVKELAQFLNVYPQVVYKWGETPPYGRQYELEVRTGGILKADEKDD